MTGPDLDLVGLTTHLQRRGVEVAGDLEAVLIAGGRSNLTYMLRDDASRWVLRRPPIAGRTASAHDVRREWTVTSALARTPVPVARPVLFEAATAVIGSEFLISEWVDGVVIRSEDELLRYPDLAIRGSIDALISTLAQLHDLEPQAVGLSDFGRPEGFLSRQVAVWRRQWDAVKGAELADLDRLHAALSDSVPEQSRTAVVHGDYRIDNAILDPADPSNVRAVVDWEMSTLGDPLCDVALMCVYRNPVLDLILGMKAAWASPSIPGADDLAHAYAGRTGRDLQNWPWYLGLAYLKLAVIAEGIAHRARQGSNGVQARDQAGAAVPDLVAHGLRVLGSGR